MTDESHIILLTEQANFQACYNTAAAEGHTQEEADNCDAGSVGCVHCPFKSDEVKH